MAPRLAKVPPDLGNVSLSLVHSSLRSVKRVHVSARFSSKCPTLGAAMIKGVTLGPRRSSNSATASEEANGLSSQRVAIGNGSAVNPLMPRFSSKLFSMFFPEE